MFNLSKSLKSNLISGLLVFLIALPLCLGIAKASGFPPIAGIYTAIIGGLLVTFMSNAPLAIKGPAAGLIAIAISAVDELGAGDNMLGYKLTIAVVAVSGVVQVLLGLVKFGKLAEIFPVSVIRGMLAAIGIIIISKQIHVMLGVAPESKSPIGSLLEIPTSILSLNPQVALIGVVSLALLFFHPQLKTSFLKKLPAPLLVLTLAIPVGIWFNFSDFHIYELGDTTYTIDPAQFLVVLPDSFLSGITFPDFSQIFSYTSIKYILMFALVGSIESVLSAKAVDAIDPKGRKTNMDKDLIAVGIGNTIAGFIGGLPMISEIVRSSANINNGAKGKMSNFYHGLFLLLFVVLAAPLISNIPNAALAAMLVYTGLKLASPQEFKKIKSVGLDQLLQFLTTVVVTLTTDLLMGVLAGISVKIIIELAQGVTIKQMFRMDTEVSHRDEGIVIRIFGIASFINYLKFKSIIAQYGKNQKITLDFSQAQFVDHTFLNNVHQMQNEFSQNGGELRKIGFNNHHFQSNHHLASRKLIKNPTNPVNIQQSLGKRAMAISEIAQKNNMEFEANLSPSFVRPYLSAFSILPNFRKAHNFLIGTRDYYNVMICDITYNKVDDLSSEISTATIAIIYNVARGGVPDFYTEKSESNLFSLITRYDFEQMPLPTKPSFRVYGDDKSLVSSFFSPSLVDTIDQAGYSIECQRRVLLVHDNWKKISSGQSMERFVAHIDSLAEKILMKESEAA